MKKNTTFTLITLSLALFTAMSCKKMDATYAGFLKNGPIVYPGKVDTMLIGAGNGRAQLKWAIPFDGNIISYKVFWNFGADSLALQGNKPTGPDSVKILINNLAEGTYNFTVYTYDKNGNKSVGSSTIGKVYGTIFTSTIYNRPIRTAIKDAKNFTLTVTWVGLDINCLGTEWTYTKTDGTSGSLFSPLGATTLITGCNVSQPITYRSVFLPEPAAIDKFYTDYSAL